MLWKSSKVEPKNPQKLIMFWSGERKPRVAVVNFRGEIGTGTSNITFNKAKLNIDDAFSQVSIPHRVKFVADVQ